MMPRKEGRMVRRITAAILAAASVLLVLLVLVALPAGAQPTRVRVIRRDTMARDSAGVLRITIHADSIERMVRELMASKQMERAVGAALRQAAAGDRGSSRHLRELSDSLGQIARKTASLITMIELNCLHGTPQREGYLGLEFSELLDVAEVEGAPALRDWPEILSIAPGSSARAGGAGGGDLGGEGSSVRRITEAEPGAPLIVQLGPPGAARVPRTPVIPPGPPEMPLMPGAFSYVFATGSSIAGATFMALDEDWRESLRVDNGVLVMKVLPGSPAKDAGLRGNDVIVSADDELVTSPRALQRIISNAKGNSVKLQVVRAGKTQTLVLRWKPSERDERDERDER